MSKSIVVSERDNIAAVMENNKVLEFFINRGDMLLGDVYLASVENILPSIDAAFVNLGGDRMGFLHASDISGKGALKDKLTPKQQILVQIVKEPTGHKGPRVTTAISLPGRFLVFMPFEKGINVSRKVVSAKERGRLKSVVNLIKPTGVGVIIRTEAEGQSEAEIQEDLESLLEKWNNIISAADTLTPPSLLYRDQDLLHRVIREACTEEVNEIVVDTHFALHRTNQLLQSWNIDQKINVHAYKGKESVLVAKGIDKEIKSALQTKVHLPSGGYLFIQVTEALAVIDVNSGKFISSSTQNETIVKTNLESVTEIARQLKLRNIGGMIIIDFIDMENRVDRLAVLEALELALEPDKAKPQVGQLSDLGLVELTRHRQGQCLAEIFTKKCPACSGSGFILEEFNFALPPQEGDFRAKATNSRGPQRPAPKLNNPNNNIGGNNNGNLNNRQISENNQNSQNNRINNNKQNQPNNQNKNDFQKKINTSPSIVASANNKIIQNNNLKQAEEPTIKLDMEMIKQVSGKQRFNPNVAKIVRFSAVPPRIAREHMDENYAPDIFSILQELESPVQSVNGPKRPINHTPMAKSHNKGFVKHNFPKPHQPKVNNIEPKQEPVQESKPDTQIELFTPVQQVEPKVEPKKPEIIQTKTDNNIVSDNQVIQEKAEIVVQKKDIEQVVEKVETVKETPQENKIEEPKKTIRRGRKPSPKSTTSSAKPATRRTPATKTAKPAPAEEK